MKTIFSMTGFASAKSTFESGEMSCEIRSLNSRYLEIFVKLPQSLKDLEDALKTRIREQVQRGKINCTVSFSTQDPALLDLQLNETAVKHYHSLLEKMRALCDINSPVQIADLLIFKDVFAMAENREVDEGLQKAIFQLLDNALERLNGIRLQEGTNLQTDLEKRLEAIEKLMANVGGLAKDNARNEFEKLTRRLFSLIDEQKVDRNRLEMELALISDRVDISEEVVRMLSHIELFRTTLNKGSPAGKRLNFILQEMHREANTISTKNTIIEISHDIVAVKEEVERMREQVQNIE